ncbi:MAG: ABC transporter permease [Bacteroidales bacterium]|nr:ABC transporter permease [Bacteroidales bacterium]
MSNNFISSIAKTFRREISRFGSRPVYLIASVIVMAFCYVFFLTFFKEGQPIRMPIGMVDLDNSSVSRQFIRNLDATQQGKIAMNLSNYQEAREEMQKGNIYAFVVIPRDFSKEIMAYHRPELTFYANDAYLIAGSLLLKDISFMSELTSAGVQQRVLRAKGVDESQIMGILQPVAIDSHLIGNPWAHYGVYLLNLLLPGVLQLVVLIMTVFVIGIELKERTSRLWFRTADNSIVAALTGKLLPYTVLFTMLGVISDLLLYSYMKYPMNSSIWWMFLTTFLFVLAYQAIGVLLIGLTPVLRDGLCLAAFYGLLGFTFAGFTFPIEHMPNMVRIFSELFPIRDYFRIYVNEALHGVDPGYSAIYFAALLAFTVLPVFVGRRLKKAAIYQHYPIK